MLIATFQQLNCLQQQWTITKFALERHTTCRVLTYGERYGKVIKDSFTAGKVCIPIEGIIIAVFYL